MKIRLMTARAALLAGLLLGGGVETRAQEVGKFAVVQNQVTSLKPGASDSVVALPGAGIVLNEKETTGPDSAAKLTFGEGAVISLGQNTTFAVTQQAVDEATGRSVSTLDLVVGKLRVFVSRFWSGRPEVQVHTPTAVIGVRGSEVVIEVFEDGRTTVTLMTGSVTIEPKGRPGSPVALSPGQQLRIGTDGTMGTAGTVPPQALIELWDRTEPKPRTSRQIPEDRPLLRVPDPSSWQATQQQAQSDRRPFISATESFSSRGDLFSDPTLFVAPGTAPACKLVVETDPAGGLFSSLQCQPPPSNRDQFRGAAPGP